MVSYSISYPREVLLLVSIDVSAYVAYLLVWNAVSSCEILLAILLMLFDQVTIDGLVQDCNISIANALELLQCLTPF